MSIFIARHHNGWNFTMWVWWSLRELAKWRCNSRNKSKKEHFATFLLSLKTNPKVFNSANCAKASRKTFLPISFLLPPTQTGNLKKFHKSRSGQWSLVNQDGTNMNRNEQQNFLLASIRIRNGNFFSQLNKIWTSCIIKPRSIKIHLCASDSKQIIAVQRAKFRLELLSLL